MARHKLMNERIKVRRRGAAVVSIEAEIPWVYAQDPETKRFVAVCNALNITLEADSVTELLPLITESMDKLFSVIAADGSIDEFLRARNWEASPHESPSRVHLPIRASNVSFKSVPLHDLQLAAC
jgi:hypothetical protein